jgi:tRNA (cmo5U34)-methyltransferase
METRDKTAQAKEPLMANYTVLAPGDKIIETVIPHYSETLDLMVSLLDAAESPGTVLDLGAGPGRISEVLHHSFPSAKLTLLDQYSDILEVARQRLANVSASYIVGDYTAVELGTGYDAIVAWITLHHLCDEDKRKMSIRLKDALCEGGMLLVCDIVSASTTAWDNRYEALWLQSLEQLPSDDYQYIKQHYREADHPATVEDNLQWLREAGLVEVACHWRYLNFAIWSGSKP